MCHRGYEHVSLLAGTNVSQHTDFSKSLQQQTTDPTNKTDSSYVIVYGAVYVVSGV